MTADVALEQTIASLENMLEILYKAPQLSFTIKELDSDFLDQLERSLRGNPCLVGYIADRFDGLRQFHKAEGFADCACYDFDKIGEVQYLKRRLQPLK